MTSLAAQSSAAALRDLPPAADNKNKNKLSQILSLRSQTVSQGHL